MNAPDRDMQDAAAGELRQQAIENISDRIKGGRGRITVYDLLDCELDNPARCRILAEEFGQLLTAEHGEHGYLADKIFDGMIERYISTHEDIVEEESAQIEHDEEEEQSVSLEADNG